MAVWVKAAGSCGEMVQGVVDGQSFLITCPIDLYSEAVIIAQPDDWDSRAGYKTRAAVAGTLAYLGVSDSGFGVRITSAIPVGKGMSSSSADISAACQAAALYVGRRLTADEIADIALTIEPTDAVFYDGIMMFDHVAGKLRRSLGVPPAMDILVFDAGGEVDTIAFNERLDLARLNKAKEEEVRRAADLVVTGLQQGDCRLIGAGATLSALANQIILPKPCLETILTISAAYGSVGVTAAHSGTVVGVLFPAGAPQQDECISAVQERCGSAVQILCRTRLTAGGLTIEKG